MPIQLPPDRFDDVRREWIAHYQGWSTIQRRRAEHLGRAVRKRQRIRTSAVPDPHDDTRIDPLVMRAAKSRAARAELAVVAVAAVVAPIGWAAGWVLKMALVRLIPQTLRGFPVAALLWAGAGLAVVTLIVSQLVYDPAGAFGQVAVLPWLCLQLVMIPTVAGIYGIAEGWLAVDGSHQWWPLTPVKKPITAADAAAILGAYDMTGPGVVDTRPLHEPGERTRP
ncbi:hypothetical protein HMPREF0591_1419 [Mycobacterium parascrofulaceum ATCC BAA-614]|uniref:Uncharacterized protein n=1 Tax=Mycobacterium parascrofulaceum ATCC BAA-614 TaxID=525368 RepID=D5P5H5_9MYCO|nr:hypothetical protein [Mycobacterium parascrofulaceum]EFG78688.1 hypothetical protein HMPREF0591_1419 [Mycobacterium parascrofulaceum ATCC BAA-614]